MEKLGTPPHLLSLLATFGAGQTQRQAEDQLEAASAGSKPAYQHPEGFERVGPKQVNHGDFWMYGRGR